LFEKIKLSPFAFYDSFISQFRNYLTNRQSSMKISGIFYLRFAAFSGVPQGSALGSLLYDIFINYICSAFKFCSWRFADDIKIFRVINSADDCTLYVI